MTVDAAGDLEMTDNLGGVDAAILNEVSHHRSMVLVKTSKWSQCMKAKE